MDIKNITHQNIAPLSMKEFLTIQNCSDLNFSDLSIFGCTLENCTNITFTQSNIDGDFKIKNCRNIDFGKKLHVCGNSFALFYASHDIKLAEDTRIDYGFYTDATERYDFEDFISYREEYFERNGVRLLTSSNIILPRDRLYLSETSELKKWHTNPDLFKGQCKELVLCNEEYMWEIYPAAFDANFDTVIFENDASFIEIPEKIFDPKKLILTNGASITMEKKKYGTVDELNAAITLYNDKKPKKVSKPDDDCMPF